MLIRPHYSQTCPVLLLFYVFYSRLSLSVRGGIHATNGVDYIFETTFHSSPSSSTFKFPYFSVSQYFFHLHMSLHNVDHLFHAGFHYSYERCKKCVKTVSLFHFHDTVENQFKITTLN